MSELHHLEDFGIICIKNVSWQQMRMHQTSFDDVVRSLTWVCRKTEVVNMLETAGFSRANPYYVVQQGKVREHLHPLLPSHAAEQKPNSAGS